MNRIARKTLKILVKLNFCLPLKPFEEKKTSTNVYKILCFRIKSQDIKPEGIWVRLRKCYRWACCRKSMFASKLQDGGYMAGLPSPPLLQNYQSATWHINLGQFLNVQMQTFWKWHKLGYLVNIFSWIIFLQLDCKVGWLIVNKFRFSIRTVLKLKKKQEE